MTIAKTMAALALVAACGSSSTTKTDAPATGSDSRAAGPTLTVKNYLSWCSVSANGGAAATAASQSVSVNPGMITLVASPASSTFEVAGNMWHHTDGDTGSGEPGTVAGTGTTATSTAKVTVASTNKCVWVCCPFANGTGCDAIADQCP